MTAPFTPNDERIRTGKENQMRDSKPTKLSQLLTMQEVIYGDATNMSLTAFERASAVRAYDVLEERVRILRGKVKPGSRNISVRELGPNDVKRLPSAPRRGSFIDQALATMERQSAQPTEPPKPTE